MKFRGWICLRVVNGCLNFNTFWNALRLTGHWFNSVSYLIFKLGALVCSSSVGDWNRRPRPSGHSSFSCLYFQILFNLIYFLALWFFHFLMILLLLIRERRWGDILRMYIFHGLNLFGESIDIDFPKVFFFLLLYLYLRLLSLYLRFGHGFFIIGELLRRLELIKNIFRPWMRHLYLIQIFMFRLLGILDWFLIF